MNKAGIYKIQRIGTDQCYVGSTACLRKRWTAHRRELNAGEHHALYLQRAWSKHGPEVFAFEVLQIIEAPTKEELREALWRAEQQWIDRLQPCFNTCAAAGSTLGFKMPRDSVERHRQLLTGRKASPEEAERLRSLAKGRKRRPETIEKLRAASAERGFPASAHENSVAARKGKPLSKEHVAKLVASRAGYKHPPEVLARMVASNTPEVRKRKGDAMRGKKQSAEHREKRIAALRAYHERKRNGAPQPGVR